MRVVELYGGGDGGGAARHLETLLPQLGQRGLEMHLLSLGRDALRPEGVLRHEASGLHALRLLSALRPAVLHTHGVRANLLGRLYGHLTGVPVVTTVHSFLALDYRDPLRAALALHVDSKTLPLSRCLIAVSQALREDLLRRGALAGSVAVVPNGIAPPPPPDRQSLPRLVPGRPLLALAARLHPAKGVDVALRALALLPDAALAVFGEGGQRAELAALAEGLGLAGRVHFLGFRADFPGCVAGADLLLVPSRAEGFGLAALEAMAQGVPVVASRVGALPEVVGAGGVLVPPDDPAALAKGIAAALRRREALGAVARAQAQRFTLAETAERTRQILAAAAEASPCA